MGSQAVVAGKDTVSSLSSALAGHPVGVSIEAAGGQPASQRDVWIEGLLLMDGCKGSAYRTGKKGKEQREVRKKQ